MRSVMLIPMVVGGAHHRRADDGVGRERARASTRTTSSSPATWRAARRRRSRTRACTPSARRPRCTLQESLLPARLPDACRAGQLASSYAAGDTTVEVGGDFFDVVELDEGFLAVVGDVTGKGVAGRGADRAGALHAAPPRRASTRARRRSSSLLNDVLVHRPEISLLTVACAHVVPTRRGRAHAPDQRRPSAPGPVARPATRRATIGPPGLLLGMTGARALAGERDRAARPATRCSSTPTASPTRRPAASASARSGCSPPCPTHRPSRAR